MSSAASTEIQAALAELVAGRDLRRKQMASLVRHIMQGEATPAQIGGLLVALSMKGETVEEISAAAEVMRELSLRVEFSGEHLVDTCGTGGDGAGLFNISTGAAFVAAAGGAHVAKHGNRAASSKSGSADVLEALGASLELSPQQVLRCIEEIGVGFLFAPRHHEAMKHAVGPRRELALRTLFNLLGPLTNPAGAKRQVLGVFDLRWLRPVAEALGMLGSEHVLVVHSEDGLDEISIAAPTRMAELKGGEVREFSIGPEDFDIAVSSTEGLTAADPQASAALLQDGLRGKRQDAADILALNGGAALYVAGVAGTLAQGVALARDLLASGQAAEKLKEFVAFTRFASAALQ